MDIEYSNKQIEKVCTNAAAAKLKHGERMAEVIHQRIDEIRASSSVEEMIQYSIGRCHKLKGSRKEQYAVDLIHPHRLVFTKCGEIVQVATIQEIVDYH